MDFGFTPEQEELRATARAFFAKHAAAVRSRAPGFVDKALWTRLTRELGLTALAIPSQHGGFGASMVEVAVVLEEAGRVLLPLPYLSTVVAAAALPGSDLLAGIAGGTVIATLAVASPITAWPDRDSYLLDGVAEHVLDGDVADLAVVAAACDGEVGLFAVALTGVARAGLTTLDQTRPVARLSFEGTRATRVSPPGDGGAAASHALDVLRLALAVESVGVAAASLEMAVSHLRTREQFGAPLATFQALRHRVADLAVTLDAATSTVWYAVRAPDVELPVVAPMAKLVAAQAAYAITAESIQLHGGIGFTWEHDAHRYFKRATVGRLTHGDPVTLRRLIGARAGL